MYKFTDGGLRDIWVANGYEIENDEFGETVAFKDINGLVAAVCQHLIRKAFTLTGAEFRYLRTAMLMSQSDLGANVGRSDQAVALWEKNDSAPKLADLFIRTLAAVKFNPDETASRLLGVGSKANGKKVVFRHTASGWISESDESTASLMDFVHEQVFKAHSSPRFCFRIASDALNERFLLSNDAEAEEQLAWAA